MTTDEKKRLALIGANGMLAKAIQSQMSEEYLVTSLDLPGFDMTDCELVSRTMEELQPQVIVNCAAYTNVDGCETEEVLASKVNGVGVGHLAKAAKEIDATLVHISTDYVFDGHKNAPYVEGDPIDPQSAYGRSKALGEKAILESGLAKYFIVRTSWLYGLGGGNFVETVIRLAQEREELRIVHDQLGTPTYTGDLAQAVFNLLGLQNSQPSRQSPYGIYHFSNEGQCSWCEFAQEIVNLLREMGEKLKAEKVTPIKTEEYPLPATRPAYSVFSKEKYKRVTASVVPVWQESLKKYLKLRSA